MASDNEFYARCNVIQRNLSEDIKHLYFPAKPQPDGYDVLPLFAVEEHNKQLMKSLSILENPIFAKKWQEFKDQLPYIARTHGVITFKSGDTITVFMNYRKMKVPADYHNRHTAKPSPEAIFYSK